MWRRRLTIVGVFVLCTATRAGAEQLSIGDPAPAITVKEFVKGAPVRSLEKGKRYVVEFWATWCGPCRVSIPHLTELQKQHPDFRFIGVSVWEQDQSGVKPFVQQMGDKMAYTVALDAVPAGGRGNDGKMAKAWMEAAGQNGIPTAFLIDRDGRIAWIGHPMELEEPLKKLAAGTWDIPAARAQFQKRQAEQQKMSQLQEKLAKAQQSGDPKQLVAVIDQAIADDPSLELNLGFQKYFILSRQLNDSEKASAYGGHLLTVLDQAIAKDPSAEASVGLQKFFLLSQQSKEPEKLSAYGNRLVDVVLKDNPGALNELAWSIVAPEAPKADAGAVKVALKAAQRSDELAKGKDPGIADTLGRAYFVAGDPAKALETQERAVSLAKDAPPEIARQLKERLEEYRKAAHGA
jgi:thiol-disulfide isomerase/thioredoxin